MFYIKGLLCYSIHLTVFVIYDNFEQKCNVPLIFITHCKVINLSFPMVCTTKSVLVNLYA